MKILKLDKNNDTNIISKTVETLKSGGLVIFPTDTVYGLLCDATNEQAVKKLISFKNRPAGKPISVFSNLEYIEKLVTISNQQLITINQILPGPFTIILPSNHRVNKLLESESGTLGVRVPIYRHLEELVNKYKKPITATSANLAGSSPHYSIESLLKESTEKQKKLIDLIIDAGKLPRNKPSTVVDLTQSDVKVLRHGDIYFLNKSKIFLSESAEETKEIASNVISNEVRNLAKRKSNRPLIFIIEGELGVGKTIFVKGIGEKLGIKNIISPTFVIYYEYFIKKLKITNQKSKMIHIDLYNIQDKQEFTYLGLEKFLEFGNILCFEWGEKAGEIIELLRNKGEIVYVKMRYIDENTRQIIINN